MTHDVEIRELWKLDDCDTKPEIQQAASKLFDWLNGRTDNLSRLLTGRACEKPRKDSIRNLEHDVIGRFKPLRETVHYLYALTLVIERGNNKKLFELCPPRIPTLEKRMPSPFREGRMPLISRPRLWREAVSGPARTSSASAGDVHIGRILASGAVNGGLLHPSLLAAFNDSLQNGLSILKDRSYLELHLPWQGKPDMELRRWFPDPLTELLTLNFARSRGPVRSSNVKHGSTTGDVWRHLRSFFKAAIPNESYRPKNITEFFELISLELKTQIPIFLVVYAERRFVSHSLKDYAWERLHGIPVGAEDTARSSVAEKPVKDDITDQSEPGSDNASAFVPMWLEGLSETLNGKDKNAARKKVANLAGSDNASNDAMLHLFTRWAEHMLVKGSATGNPLSLGTIRDYVRRVSVRVVGLSAFQDITALTAEALEEIYQQILEGATSFAQRRHHARGLREFHHYLVRHHQVDPIDEREIFGIGNALAPVDANIITIDEYKKILARLDTLGLEIRHPDLPLIAKLLVILSFRCTLRRMEVLKLEMQDLHDDEPAELLVRPHANRRLKTKSSTRKIPLYALLEPEELALLKQWKAKRMKQHGREEPFYLFGIPELLYAFVPSESIFPVIHRVMREVTGDPTVHFHHLRHSAASWNLLRLVLSGLGTSPEIFSHLPETRAFLAASKDFRKRLYGHDQPTRKHSYAIASLMGHSGPDISYAHYIHTCDLLLAVALASRPDAVDESALVRYSGLPETTAYRLLQQQGVSGLLAAVRKCAGANVRRPKAGQLRPGAQKPAKAVLTAKKDGDDGLAAGILERVWGYLFARSARNKSREEQARRFGFSFVQAEALEVQAAHIRDLRVADKGRGWRHRMLEIVPDKRLPEETRRLLSPRLPHLARDKAVLQEFAPRLWRLMRTDEALCRRVLDYFTEHAWGTRNELVFHDPSRPESAKDYLAFLEALGIDRKHIRFVAYQRKKRSKAVATWKAALGLGWRAHVGRLAPPRSASMATEHWFGIKPIFGNEGSYGFRFLLTMAAIYIHSADGSRYSEGLLPDAA